MTTVTADACRDVVQQAIRDHRDLPGAMLPVLHAIQDKLGYVPTDAVPAIAEALNVSRAEVHGVLTYYHHFRTDPAGRHVIQVCRAEACQAMGAEALWKHACERVGDGNDPPRTVTLEAVYCLGLCAAAPAAMVDASLHARVDPDRFDRLVANLGVAV